MHASVLAYQQLRAPEYPGLSLPPIMPLITARASSRKCSHSPRSLFRTGQITHHNSMLSRVAPRFTKFARPQGYTHTHTRIADSPRGPPRVSFLARAGQTRTADLAFPLELRAQASTPTLPLGLPAWFAPDTTTNTPKWSFLRSLSSRASLPLMFCLSSLRYDSSCYSASEVCLP